MTFNYEVCILNSTNIASWYLFCISHIFRTQIKNKVCLTVSETSSHAQIRLGIKNS